jgi:hypothetical protein
MPSPPSGQIGTWCEGASGGLPAALVVDLRRGAVAVGFPNPDDFNTDTGLAIPPGMASPAEDARGASPLRFTGE